MNFPCHLVLIKGTHRYSQGKGSDEYNINEIQQMIGRAGRPQFDDSGVAGRLLI